jgi:TolB-like protein/Flp pilus assembly protein TadD
MDAPFHSDTIDAGADGRLDGLGLRASGMTITGIVRELQRRNVLRAGILYATSIWALTQGIASLEPVVGAPQWVARWFLVAAVIGFPFWIAFAWLYELTPDGIRRESQVVQSESLTRATGRRLDFWIIGALSIAVVLLLTDRFIGHSETSSTNVIAEKSVAVLPLVNESGDTNALYFSDGLSEGFINALSQFAGLKVIGRASSFQFRSSRDPVSVIGAKLGVAHLLEGSVQRAGGAVRISAELINASDGIAIWSKNYDRPYTDLFKLQDDITNAVASALKAKLLGGGNASPPQTDRPPSGNLAAYNALLEGQFYLHRYNEESEQKGVEAFQEAVRLDPRYAQAWAGLSMALQDVGYVQTDPARVEAKYKLARTAADKANALGPQLSIVHNARGIILQYLDFDWNGAAAEFRRAAELAPGDVSPKSNLSVVLMTLGQTEAAVQLIREALKIDPLRAQFYADLASYQILLGHLPQAEQAMHKAIQLDPTGFNYYQVPSFISILRGDATSALTEAQRESRQPYRDLNVALAMQISPDRAAADAALKNLIDKYAGIAAYQVGDAYAIRKDPDNMFKWLERAYTQKDVGLLGMTGDPFLLPYRHDLRFAALCKEMKLPVPAN